MGISKGEFEVLRNDIKSILEKTIEAHTLLHKSVVPRLDEHAESLKVMRPIVDDAKNHMDTSKAKNNWLLYIGIPTSLGLAGTVYWGASSWVHGIVMTAIDQHEKLKHTIDAFKGILKHGKF